MQAVDLTKLEADIQRLRSRLGEARSLASKAANEMLGNDHIPCTNDGAELIREEVICRLWSSGFKDVDVVVEMGDVGKCVVNVWDRRLEMLEKVYQMKCMADAGFTDCEIDQIMCKREGR